VFEKNNILISFSQKRLCYSKRSFNANKKSLREYHHRGGTYIEGRAGSNYDLVFRNNTSRSVEAVFSVDGLDILDGKKAKTSKPGYIIRPYSSIVIQGWRLDNESVARFKFDEKMNSYAAKKGKSRNIGIIGAAVFYEKRKTLTRFLRSVVDNNDINYHFSDRGYTIQNCSSETSFSTKSSGRRSSKSGGDEVKSLGTAFGKKIASEVININFERESENPNEVLSIRYNNREGLEALGIPVAQPLLEELQERETAVPFEDIGGGCTPPNDWEG